MKDAQYAIDLIKKSSASEPKRKIKAEHALMKDLFDLLCQQINIQCKHVFFCTKEGLILSYFSTDSDPDLSGNIIPGEVLHSLAQYLSFDYSIDGFLVITDCPAHIDPLLKQLQVILKKQLEIYRSNEDRAQYLLHCLDSMENALCVYDKTTAFLYGNKSYCKAMHIKDRESAIGMCINDIIKQYGIKIRSQKTGADNLKMLDVLNTGRKALEWEIMIESQNSTNEAQYISDNMYPIKDEDGNVEGVIETFHSHRLNLTKTKKLIGLTAEYTFDSIIGSSAAIKESIDQAKEYADSSYNLLLSGESGVGKELFAQAIHNYSSRQNESFIALNCANFPENLIESELFGYVGGAFTGAAQNGQIGKFELANGGTLFLDEIGELPYHFQAKLLRVLETQKITRIGGSSEISIDVRIISATNRELEKMIEEGFFRKDLYYRLQVLSVQIPPLRERREDILVLAESFLEQLAKSDASTPKRLSFDARENLLKYDWPGNVRELRNVIQRVTLLSKAGVIPGDVLEAAISSKGYTMVSTVNETPDSRLSKCMAEVDRSYANLIKEALDIANGNKKQAAALLGVSRQTFYRMLEKYSN